MNTLIHSVYHRSLNKQALNILLFSYDTLFEYFLALQYPQHTFHIILDMCSWQGNSTHLSKLKNVVCYKQKAQLEYTSINYDAVICNDIVTSIEYATHISNSLHIPIINIDHRPHSQLRPEDGVILSKKFSHLRTYTPTNLAANLFRYNIPTYDIKPKHTSIINVVPPVLQTLLQDTPLNSANGLEPLVNIFMQAPHAKFFVYFTQPHQTILPALYAMANHTVLITNSKYLDNIAIYTQSLKDAIVQLNTLEQDQQAIEAQRTKQHQFIQQYFTNNNNNDLFNYIQQHVFIRKIT